MLETEISKTGDVVVEGHTLGRLEGFRFAADASAGGSEAKALRTAAQKALAGEISARSIRLAAAGDEQFVLTSDGTIRWLGDAVAKLAAGEAVLKPQVRLIADEQLTGAPRDAVQARLDLWIKAHIEKLLGPLLALERAEDVTGIARGIAFQLTEAIGVLERQKVADQIKSLDQKARALLRNYGVRFGAYHIYLPALLKPAPRGLALQLWALMQNAAELKGFEELPQLASSGRTSLPVDKEVSKALYRTIGYRVCGERAVRVDILERLADLIRPALAWRSASPGIKPAGAVDGSCFTITGSMTSLVGSSGEDFASVLRSLGYRMEQRAKPAEAAPAAPAADEASPAALGTAPVAPDTAAFSDDGAPEAPTTTPIGETVPGASVPAAPTEEALAAPPLATPAAGAPEDEAAVEDPIQVAAAANADADAGAMGQSAAAPDPVALGTAPIAPESAGSGMADTASADNQASTTATETPAAANEADQGAAEPVLIEVWRPGRSEERRPPRADAQRAHRPRHRREAVRSPAASTAATPPDVASTPEAAALPAAPGETREAPADAPRRDRGGERGQRPKREDERGARPFSKGPRDKDRPRDRDRPRRDERGERSKAQEWKTHLPRERRDSAPDPNSPFAKLLALKEQLEADAKERR